MSEKPIIDFGDNSIGRAISVGTPYINEDGQDVVDVITELRDPIIKRLKLDIEKECVDREGKHKANTRWFLRTYIREHVRPPQFFVFPDSGHNVQKIRVTCGFNGEPTDLTMINEELSERLKYCRQSNVNKARQIIKLTKENERLRSDFEDYIKWIKEVGPSRPPVMQQQEEDEHGERRF